MGMKKHMNEMETVEMLIKMMNEKIAADELATEISVPVMLKGRTIHHYTMDDRVNMEEAVYQRNMEIAKLRWLRMIKADRDNENWYFGRYIKGSRTLSYDVVVHDSKLWKPLRKAEQHKGLEKSYVAESDSNGNADNDPWAYEESGYWTEYLKAKEMAETIAATEIAAWKETAQFYANKANAFRMEVMMLRDIIKANGIDF